ncbi:hypothetical protein [Sinorhizobium meliloti]|uniref:hypothetical protein n=1 Tax=Rhizobium meliloti TaxID=382 RepID=UPI000FDB8B44|nr:hypothetical protein [Sinorhizobium meliloti]QGJ73800.1 hypothetical protein C3L21_07110 [Sinorhizobium meliloti]RVG89041.1 hypothetical protein CN218_26180 [Sinorhizobium meliloti]RVK89645.1 hypothetical protein CN150_30150 [Sinorhizobium meliloti]RVL60738.1 hypothetical protein CN137_18250 [Sinorhizobium meliloti]
MNQKALEQMRDFYAVNIKYAEDMIEFLKKYRWVSKALDDQRSDDEVINEQVEMHRRLIDNYSRSISMLETRIRAAQ